jgi:hypothetical protein|tara:strand:- start:694 stop:897 length:204 start_codon:yes stop_codon:yes gene_type:complete
MSCCVNLVDYLKTNIEYIGIEFDIFLNKLLEIDKDKKVYNIINLVEINKDIDHTIVDIPINKGYNII